MGAQEYFDLGMDSVNNNELLKAIDYFILAENANKDRKFPDASLNIGSCFILLGKYRKALNIFTKIEQDYKVDVSFDIASCLMELGRYREAIKYFDKVKDDDTNKKYVSYNKSLCLSSLGKYQEAIEILTEAEQNRKNGKYPDASSQKGFCFSEIGKWEKAFKSYTKAEQDSKNRKHPVSSHNKGVLLMELGIYEKAIKSYSKAEKDFKFENKKKPDTSFYKGRCLVRMYKYKEAIFSFQKTIDDSEDLDHGYPKAYVELSRCYTSLGNHQKASNIIFNELHRYNRNYLIMDFLVDNFSVENSNRFYKNRLNYLALKFDEFVNGQDFKKNNDLFKKYISRLNKPLQNTTIFLDLLQIESVEFAKPINYRERLKLCYLVHYINGEPHQTFNIIDSLLDTEDHSLDEMDYYFYLRSAYMIGEPKKELEYFTNVAFDKNTKFGLAYSLLSNDLQGSIEQNNYLDTYLLDCPAIREPISDDFHDDQYHPWINEALRSIDSKEITYTIPVSENELKGMTTQLFNGLLTDLSSNEYEDNNNYHNVIESIAGGKSGVTNYLILIKNIRDAMSDDEVKIPHQLILMKLCERYYLANNEAQKHNLSIAQAALLISHHVDQLKKPLLSNSGVEIATTNAMDMIGEKTISTILGISASFIFDYGLSIALSIISGRTYKYISNKDKERIDALFEELLSEIIPE